MRSQPHGQREGLGARVDRAQLAWGPNGHIVRTGNNATGTMAYETLHWGGHTLLFTTNNAGALDDIKIGGPANFVASSGAVKVAFNDRDFSGAIASSHTIAGAGTWNPPKPNRQLCSSAGTNDPITQPGPDGINIFQGARAYDPVLGNGTAPDAYAGNVGDPMSQKTYVWDGNNSFVYEDPSGYDACANGECAHQKPPRKPRTIARVYNHPTFKTLGQILASVRIERGGSVALYRVVGEAELKDIEDTGGFRLLYGTSEVKGFFGSLDKAM